MKGPNDHTTAGAEKQGEKPKEEEKKDEDVKLDDIKLEDAKKNFEFQVKYFPIDDGSTDAAGADADPSMYAQFEACLTREQYEALTGQNIDEEKPKRSNKGKHLMLFNDRSYSMSGTPFETLKKACVTLADTVFSNDEASPEDNQFEQVHTYFYDNTIINMSTSSKKAYVDYINNAHVNGSTNFAICYQQILKLIEAAAEGNEYFILFMTDGLDNCNGKVQLKQNLDQMSAKFKQLAAEKGVSVTVYCMGLSKSHDAQLLNDLAQAGTQMGNFIYIDTQQAGYQEQLNAAVSESLGLAMTQSTKPRMTLVNDSTSFRETKMCEITHEYEEAKEVAADPQSTEEAKEDAKVDDEQIVSTSVAAQADQDDELIDLNQKWTEIKYHTSMIMKKSQLLDKNLKLEVELTKEVQLEGPAVCMEVQDPPDALLKSAELQLINRNIFDLIQAIQKAGDLGDKKNALEKLKAIDRSLIAKHEEYMKIKDKEMRKELLTKIQECKERSNTVIAQLREVQNLGNLTNEVIAKLNNLAYKGIKVPNRLSALLDKRALANKDLFEKLEKECKAIIKKYDFNKITTDNLKIIDAVGSCAFSCMDTVEAIQDRDCMCIGLSVNRPEAAIADPTRLTIRDIIPTYLTADSFLESAKFKIDAAAGDQKKAHGGFKEGDGHLAMGLGRENITGIMPLYLFPEHWNVAKRKVQPVYGFMCTLDVMGYASEQFFTVPFLVLLKAMLKASTEPTEVNKRILDQVEQTCVVMMDTNRTFRNEIVGRFVNFTAKQGTESFRTSDVVKNLSVLAAQVHCLFKVPDLMEKIESEEHKKQLENAEEVKQMKQKFVRFAVEEILRRNANQGEELTSDLKLAAALFPEHQKFVDDTFAKREKEIVELHGVAPEQVVDAFKAYDKQVKDLKKKFGYDTEEIKLQEGKKEEEAASPSAKEQVDFEKEVKDAIMKKPWADLDHAAVKHCDEIFKKHYQDFMLVANALLEGGDDDKIVDLAGIPFAKEAAKPNEYLLAIILQNAFHKNNSQRVDAVKDKKYIGVLTGDKATQYLAHLLTNNLMMRLKSQESALIKKFSDHKAKDLAEKLLLAPDFVYAACMMRQNGIFFGKGDFQNIIDLLKTKKSNQYKDIGNKLALIKTGRLYKKGILPDLNDAGSAGIPNEVVAGEADFVNIYQDAKRTFITHAVNYKHVFSIWATQVYGQAGQADKPDDGAIHSNLTQAQLENVFPDFKAKLQLYHHCCDRNGKVVKDKEYYAKYKSAPHAMGRRGLNQEQQKVRAAYKAKKKML